MQKQLISIMGFFLKSMMAVIIILVASCSGTRHLIPGQKLFTGSSIVLKTSDSLSKSKTKFIKNTAESSVNVLPNKTFLGMRPKLWLYMTVGENPKSKFKKWIQRMGEPPVYMSQINPSLTAEIMDAQLFNMGIFEAQTTFQLTEMKKSERVIYSCNVLRPYRITKVDYLISNNSLNQLINRIKGESLVKTEDDYDLEKLSNERVRIDNYLKNNGYFFFNPDYLLFVADTSAKNRTVTLTLKLKDSIPESAKTAFRINQVFIDQNFSLNTDDIKSPTDTLHFLNTIFLGNKEDMDIRPKVVLDAVFVKKDELYSRKDHNMTLNRLMSMGNFKFVQLQFKEVDSALWPQLDATILMTPLPRHNFQTEVDIVSKSNNYTGPKLDLSFLNRNALGGAEILQFNIEGAFEFQLGGSNKNLYSYSINPKLELYFPRFILPFKINAISQYTPKTSISLSFKFLKMVNYYNMQTLELIYGYRWKTNITKEQEFNPISISFSQFSNQSAEFIALIESNPYLKQSYEEQFIAGGSYAFTYNEQVFAHKKTQFYFHPIIEIAGNSISLVKRLAGQTISPDSSSKVAGSVYSQFARFSLDGRSYYNLKGQSKIVSRVLLGLAVPYGNTNTLPYSKQFFAGGPSGLRAFHINSLGPGNYDQANDSSDFLQLGGDVKVEANLEFRFDIISYFKGALFVDAGNVWQLKSNPSKIGTPFGLSSFLSEMAVGAGAGIRIDLSFFVLRFDLAMPLRKPWLESHNRWVIKDINMGSSFWRRENLLLNIAIGYPF
jgi:outer membrane protein assembly factor BamA